MSDTTPNDKDGFGFAVRVDSNGRPEVMPSIHPACPKCGRLWDTIDMVPTPDGMVYMGNEMVENEQGQMCFVFLTQVNCDCGHIEYFNLPGQEEKS